MKKYIYLFSFFITYLFCSVYYYNWDMDVRREYGNIIIPMIFYTVCSIFLGILFFLFLQECFKSKKRHSKMLLFTMIGLFVLAFIPYAFYIPDLPIFVYSIFKYFVKLIDFTPIAGFSAAMCLMMYIKNVRKFKKQSNITAQ